MRTYFAVVGVLCLAGAVWLTAWRLRVLLFGMVAQGTVIGHEAREIEESKSYIPVVSFYDQKGVEFRFTAVAGGGRRWPAVGALVPVRYLPSDPGLAYIGSFLHMWAAPLACVALGIATLWIP